VRIVLITASSAMALGIAELAVRAMPPAMLGFGFVNDHFIAPLEFERDTTVNRLNMHDRQPRPRAKGTRRVLLLGDSYVAAVSVPIPQGVSRRLEAHLSEKEELGPVDVVSLGKEGWGQRDELNILRRRGRGLRPDLVLLLFTARNDVYNNAIKLPEKIRAQRLLREARQAHTPLPYLIRAEDARGLVLKSSALNRLISHRLTLPKARAAVPLPAPFAAFDLSAQKRWNNAWSETEKLLLRLRSEAKAIGARFAVASTSTPEGVLAPAEGAARLRASHREFADTEFDTDLVDRRLAEICERNQISLTTMQPALRELQAETGEPLHWPLDGHWNRAGNEAAAKLMADFAASVLGPAASPAKEN
jgi:hypothetical protein